MVSFRKKYTKDSTKLKEVQQLTFIKRLNRLLNDGYSLTNALETIKWDRQLAKAADIIIGALTSGEYADEAFKRAKFHPSIVSYLYFVRINGDMMSSMGKCIEMFDHRMKSVGKFRQVIRYPAVLLGFFAVLLFFLKWSVLPAFTDIFQSSDESAKTVMISVNIIDLFGTICILLMITGIVGIVFWKHMRKNVSIEKRIRIYEKIPVFRYILRLQTSYYFATHMSMFLKTGMSMKNVIIHMTNQKELPLIAYYASLMKVHLQNGFYIDQLMESMAFIEGQMTIIFKNSTNINDLELDLTAYAEFLMEMIENKIMRMITLIQPAFFTMLACLIIFVYLTLMWPMFQLINTI